MPMIAITYVPPGVALVVPTVSVTGAPPIGIDAALKLAVNPAAHSSANPCPALLRSQIRRRVEACSAVTLIELIPRFPRR